MSRRRGSSASCQGDLYQLAASATRFKPEGVSALVYPRGDDLLATTSAVERLGPWRSDGQTLTFTRLPTAIDECREALRELIGRQAE
jgi:hypothetical protein